MARTPTKKRTPRRHRVLSSNGRVVLETMLAQVSGGGMTRAQRVAKAAKDFIWFACYYFPHYITTEPCAFHRAIGDAVNTTEPDPRINIEGPRDHGKTSIIMIAFCYAIVLKKRRNLLELGNTDVDGYELYSDIRTELDENERLIQDFGRQRSTKAGHWTDDQLITRNNIKLSWSHRRARIRGRKHRQWRYDLIMFDDPQDEVDCTSAKQLDKDHEWWMSTVTNSCRGALIVVGNNIHPKCLVAQLKDNPAYTTVSFDAILSEPVHEDLWQDWEKVFRTGGKTVPERRAAAQRFYERRQDKMDEGVRVLAPAMMSYYKLRLKKLEIGLMAWLKNFRGRSIDPATRIFHTDNVGVYSESDLDAATKRQLYPWGVVDPNHDEDAKKTNCPMALLTFGVHSETDTIYVRDAVIQHLRPDQLIQQFVLGYSRWKWRRFLAETVGAQTFQRWMLEAIGDLGGIKLKIEGIKPVGKKEYRIATDLEPLFNSGRLLIERRLTTLLAQLYEFPDGFIDGPDVISLFVQHTIKMRTRKSGKAQTASTKKAIFADGSPWADLAARAAMSKLRSSSGRPARRGVARRIKSQLSKQFQGVW